MYARITKAIKVTVEPSFLEDQSAPEDDHFVWAYHIRIENNGERTVRLLTRHWQITDLLGKVHEVQGDGVIGEQPVLRPGETFEYSSGAPLGTPSGFMVGTYGMISESGQRFDVDIPAFSLDSPYQNMQIH